jgi:hypothetical protein
MHITRRRTSCTGQDRPHRQTSVSRPAPPLHPLHVTQTCRCNLPFLQHSHTQSRKKSHATRKVAKRLTQHAKSQNVSRNTQSRKTSHATAARTHNICCYHRTDRTAAAAKTNALKTPSQTARSTFHVVQQVT